MPTPPRRPPPRRPGPPGPPVRPGPVVPPVRPHIPLGPLHPAPPPAPVPVPVRPTPSTPITPDKRDAPLGLQLEQWIDPHNLPEALEQLRDLQHLVDGASYYIGRVLVLLEDNDWWRQSPVRRNDSLTRLDQTPTRVDAAEAPLHTQGDTGAGGDRSCRAMRLSLPAHAETSSSPGDRSGDGHGRASGAWQTDRRRGSMSPTQASTTVTQRPRQREAVRAWRRGTAPSTTSREGSLHRDHRHATAHAPCDTQHG